MTSQILVPFFINSEKLKKVWLHTTLKIILFNKSTHNHLKIIRNSGGALGRARCCVVALPQIDMCFFLIFVPLIKLYQLYVTPWFLSVLPTDYLLLSTSCFSFFFHKSPHQIGVPILQDLKEHALYLCRGGATLNVVGAQAPTKFWKIIIRNKFSPWL